MYRVLCPQELQRNSTSLQFKTKLLHINQHHYTPHHFTYLRSILTSVSLLVTTFLTHFLNVFSLQAKDASKPAGDWFQLLMVRGTQEGRFQPQLLAVCREFEIISMCAVCVSTSVADHYCVCTVHVIRSLNCQYQHMHNFNVTG